MIRRAYIHVAGPAGSGKTSFIEALLRATDGWVLAARCVQDPTLSGSRESAPEDDPELGRYEEAGAGGVARFEFPASGDTADDFFMTDLMAHYSEAVVLEGDNPLGYVDVSVFVAPPLPSGERLFVRRTRDRARERRTNAADLERLLREPDGVARLMEQMIGGPITDVIRAHPELAEKARADLLDGLARARKAPPPRPTGHWAIAESHAGIERAQLVIVSAREEDERVRAERLVADIRRLREDDALFDDILGIHGTRVPITAVAADLGDPSDRGLKKAIGRVKRTLKRVVS